MKVHIGEKGKWNVSFASNGWMDWTCSLCGFTLNEDVHVYVDWDFCPKCGADLRREKKTMKKET